MTRPRNPFLNPGDFGVLGRNPEYDAFEEGVDAGRKWGHEEKDEEWRETIRKVLAAHTEGITYGGKRIIAVEHIEELL